MEMLPTCEANYVPLTPITFLERASMVYADRTSIIYGSTRFTWTQTFDRCRRLASSLLKMGISKNDVVSVLAPNIPAMYEMHFAVPMAGAVLNTINSRLDAANVALILKHSEAKAFFVDYQYVPVAVDALRLLVNAGVVLPTVVVIDDVDAPTAIGGLEYDALRRLIYSDGKLPLVVVADDVGIPNGTRVGDLEYERLIATGDPNHRVYVVRDELDPITLNYTSGTTSAPKGVVYSHRGAYLSTMSLLLQWGVGPFPVYMWSLPMFHCNGWTFTWGMAARGGTNVCIRNTCAAEMYHSIFTHRVTHMCCAPIVFNILLEAKPEERRPIQSPVHVLTGGAPPPAALLEKIEKQGFNVTHAYGLTEATGPAMVCEWQPEWNRLSASDRSILKQRQGVSVLTLAGADVKNPQTMASVPRDGRSMGEIVLRGSSIMKGYYKNVADTEKAFKNGWFWTGDVGVVHPDGYIEIKDRSKDVIISGGENISSVEVENFLYLHPKITEAAVVAMPHPKWGESPCAFVAARRDSKIEEREVIEYCRGKIAGFMVPKKVVVMANGLPKTSTGKILKFKLRELAQSFKVREEKKTTTTTTSSSSSHGKSAVLNRRINPNNDLHHPQEQVLAISRL